MFSNYSNYQIKENFDSNNKNEIDSIYKYYKLIKDLFIKLLMATFFLITPFICLLSILIIELIKDNNGFNHQVYIFCTIIAAIFIVISIIVTSFVKESLDNSKINNDIQKVKFKYLFNKDKDDNKQPILQLELYFFLTITIVLSIFFIDVYLFVRLISFKTIILLFIIAIIIFIFIFIIKYIFIPNYEEKIKDNTEKKIINKFIDTNQNNTDVNENNKKLIKDYYNSLFGLSCFFLICLVIYWVIFSFR